MPKPHTYLPQPPPCPDLPPSNQPPLFLPIPPPPAKYSSAAEAAEAIRALSGTQLLGREVVLEQARSGGGGGGGGAVGGAVPTPTASEACWFCLGSSAADLGLVVRGVRLCWGGPTVFLPPNKGGAWVVAPREWG